MPVLGGRVTVALLVRDISQNELAAQLRVRFPSAAVTQQALSKLISPKEDPPPRRPVRCRQRLLEALAGLLSVPSEWLSGAKRWLPFTGPSAWDVVHHFWRHFGEAIELRKSGDAQAALRVIGRQLPTMARVLDEFETPHVHADPPTPIHPHEIRGVITALIARQKNRQFTVRTTEREMVELETLFGRVQGLMARPWREEWARMGYAQVELAESMIAINDLVESSLVTRAYQAWLRDRGLQTTPFPGRVLEGQCYTFPAPWDEWHRIATALRSLVHLTHWRLRLLTMRPGYLAELHARQGYDPSTETMLSLEKAMGHLLEPWFAGETRLNVQGLEQAAAVPTHTWGGSVPGVANTGTLAANARQAELEAAVPPQGAQSTLVPPPPEWFQEALAKERAARQRGTATKAGAAAKAPAKKMKKSGRRFSHRRARRSRA